MLYQFCAKQLARRLSTLSQAMPRAAAIAVSHGGGPMPVLGDPAHKDIVNSLRHRVPKILKLGTPDAPRAIVVVTAHWSEGRPTISSGKKHSLLYDYGGFPAAAYRLKYDAPGSPEVAEEVRQAFVNAGLDPVTDEERGWDHGVFIPFLLINPAADIPVVQVSVLHSEDPAAHLSMGRALGALRDSNIAVVGSGFASFHNLPAMRHLMGSGNPGPLRARTEEWNAALTAAVTEPDREKREASLGKWREFPHSYDMHPRYGAEHFLPLLVVAGAAGEEDGKAKAYKDDFLGIDIWTYYWSDVEV